MHLQSRRARTNSALYLRLSKSLFPTLQAGPLAMGTDLPSKNLDVREGWLAAKTLFCKLGMLVCTCLGRRRN